MQNKVLDGGIVAVVITTEKVRAVVQTGTRQMSVEEFPRPKIGEDDALLRVEACGICGTDVEQYRGQTEELGIAKYPLIPGHEPLGIIDEIGPHAAARWGVGVGDRVAVEPNLACWRCEACLRGERTHCTGWGRMMSYGFIEIDVEPTVWGAYSEYMYLHPNTVVHKMTRDLPADLAVMFNPLGAGVRWGYSAGTTKMGDTVVILGSGQRGISCVIAARAAGAGTIIVTDVSRAGKKLELASEVGADHIIQVDLEDTVERVQEITNGRLADVVIDVSAVATEPIVDAVEITRPGGTIVLAGIKGRPVPELNTDKLVFKSIRMQGVFTVDTAGYREAIRLIESGKVPLERMHTRTYSLDDAEEAVKFLGGEGSDDEVAIHVAIAPHSTSE
jgi:threonine dehydrogenase-like Zn-dependent dehydrogenase